MANFEIPETLEYIDQIRKLETADPAHADLFNMVFQALINNDAFIKKVAEEAIFEQAETRENIASGEKVSVIFGKIKKWFADLEKVAFSGDYKDLEGKPTIPAAVAVKGDAEDDYRTGDVNLTAEHIGAYGKLNIGTDGYKYQNNCIMVSGVSLNEIDESGLYFCDAPVDAPVDKNGFMIAITYAGKIRGMQLFMPLGENQIYKRQNTNGTWGDWEKINAGNAETAINKDGDSVPGVINFINNARIRFIAPDVTSVHAKGIDFVNKTGSGIWGGIGVYGQGGQNTAIYLAADTPGPWEPANGLFITGSSIKWKNSSLVTEDSSIIGNIMDALSALAYDDWEECTMGTGGWTDFNGHCYISTIPKSEVADGQTFLCKFCGMVCGATAAINSRGEYYFKNVVWYTRKTAGPVRDQITAAAGGFSSGNGPGLPGGAYSSTVGLVVRMSTVNSALKSYYRKI